MTGDVMSVTQPGGDYEFVEFDVRVFSGVPEQINVEGENVMETLAGNSRITIGETMLRGENGFPASGAVAIAQLGSHNESYDIVAGNANPDTFIFTETNDGATTSYELAWSLVCNFADLNYLTEDVGF